MFSKDSLYFAFLNASRKHYLRTHMLLSEIGVYHGQPPLLFLLEKNDGLSQKEIGEKLKTTASTITVMLKRMEKSGIIKKKQDPDDQRIYRIYLTEKGRDVSIKAKAAIETLAYECFEGFSEQEKEEFKKLLGKMENNLKEKLE